MSDNTLTGNTVDDLVNSIRGIAARNPGRTYHRPAPSGISYNPSSDNPLGCLIGAAARDVGLDTRNWDSAELLSDILDRLFSVDSVDDLRLTWVNEVQYHQDRGVPWARAVALADEDFPLV